MRKRLAIVARTPPVKKIIVPCLLVLCAALSLWPQEGRGGSKREALQAYESLLRAQEALEEGKDSKVEAILRGINSPGVWDFWKFTLLARAHVNENRPQLALNLLKELPAPPPGLINKEERFYRKLYKDALETGLAASRLLSQPDEAWARQLWAHFPDFEQLATAEIPTDLHVADKIARQHILFELARFDPIPSLLSADEIATADLPTQDKCRALFEWSMATQKVGGKEEALSGFTILDEKGGSHCDPKMMDRALYWKGNLETDLQNYAAAEATFKRLAKHNDSQYADDGYYRLYKAYQARNEADKADRALHNLTALSQGDMKEKYFWEEAYLAYQNKDFKKASEHLDHIIAMRCIGKEAQAQALYWKARFAEISSDKKLGGGSAALYEKLTKTYPFSFYAIFAETRLDKPITIPAVAKLKPARSADTAVTNALHVIDELNRKQKHDEARDVLDYITQLQPQLTKEKPELVAQRWMDSEDFNRALELASEQLGQSAFDINLNKDAPLTRIMYPLAYPDEIERAAKATQLPQALIAAIMREESLFRPEVRSSVGAFGLMQLMPATARLTARSQGLAYSPDELKRPAYNIRLGAAYLRDMMDRFNDTPALAVMAYNAGPGNISKWLRTQGGVPLDEFIEAVPFSETRNYVKRVLRSAHIYEHLMGKTKRTILVKSLDPL